MDIKQFRIEHISTAVLVWHISNDATESGPEYEGALGPRPRPGPESQNTRFCFQVAQTYFLCLCILRPIFIRRL